VTEDHTNEIIEAAQAVKATADATSKAIGALEKTGGFFDRVFGGLVEDGVGIVADKVKFYRFQRAVEFAEKTEQILKEKGLGDKTAKTKEVPPKTAIPLIEFATLEDNDDLQTMWARLLANAMDGNFTIEITNVHISIMKDLQAVDVKILNRLYSEAGRSSKAYDELLFDKKKVAQVIGITETQTELSLLNLMRLGCVKPGNVITRGISFGNMPNTVYKGTDEFSLSELGASLCKAAMTQ
jgi:hypothetical protein